MKRIFLLLITCILINTFLLAQTWTTVTPNETGSATGITIHNNAIFISTQAASPYQSTNGNTWEKKDNGITTLAGPQGGGIGSAGTYLYYGSKDTIYRSNDNGNTWTGAGNGISVSAFNFGRYFYEFNGVYFCSMSGAKSSGGGLFRSEDGVNWTSSTLGGSNGETAYEMTEIGGKLYVGSNMSFYESLDTGLTWTSVSTNGAKVYRGLIEHQGRRLILTTFGMEFSDDNGTTWDTLTTNIKSSTSCGFVKGTGDTLYVYTSALSAEGIFYSVDRGDTWTEISGDLTTNELKFMNEMHYFNGSLYLATFLAVKSNGSSNGGSSTTPAAPTNLMATPSKASLIGNIDLTWTDNANNEDGFKVERSPDGINSWTEIASLGIDVESYQDAGLDPNTIFYYRVLAFNSNGNSTFSNVVNATTLATNISDQLANNSISFYPNPFKENLTVKNTQEKTLDISITNSIGQTILETRSFENSLVINTENLFQGVYFIKVTDTENQNIVFVKKIIHQ